MKNSYCKILLQTSKVLIFYFAFLSIAVTASAEKLNQTPISMPVEGHLVFTGSEALSNLISYLAQSFTDYNPLISVTIADPGGMAGLDALINGSADLVLSSTPISDRHKQEFEKRFGYLPEVIPVAMDAVAVYVNNLNPLTTISRQQLDAIFSNSLRCGESKPIKNWNELEIKGVLANSNIHVYGLTVNTGATDLFRKVVLCGGDFIKDFQALPGPSAIELALISDYAGIGFSNSTIRSSALHVLAIRFDNKSPAVAPVPETIRSDSYKMSRTLSIIVNHRIHQQLPPPIQTFLNFIQSQQGHDIIIKAGYEPLS